ncbi:MAG: OB-fold nucleic acid binding domain-containing protein [Actinobacteria bacterium]|nr:OB-fold nucleic acid binding domain-containing protein [Actinomycetota bacterium]
MPVVALLKRFIEGFTKAPEETRAENLARWISTLEGVTPLSQVAPRQRYRVAGVIQNIRIDPREGRDSIEATIIDGSGRMIVKWLGRSSMLGVGLGKGLVVEGIVGESEGMRVMINPEWNLVPGPEHG